MVANQKVTGRASSIPLGLTAGAALSVGMTVLISAAAAFLISEEIIASEGIGYCAMGALILSSLCGSWVAANRIKRMPLQMALLCGGVFFLMLLSMTTLFFGGQYEGMGTTLIMIFAGSFAGGMLAAGKPKRRNQKHHKKSYR